MEIADIRKRLENLTDENYAIFNKKLCPDTSKKIIGIRIPQLRNLAKQIVTSEKWKEMIDEFDVNIFEETILKGLVIGYSKISIEENLR
jgi:3-methyladenine DNA glycosylase AlkD